MNLKRKSRKGKSRKTRDLCDKNYLKTLYICGIVQNDKRQRRQSYDKEDNEI